MRSKIFLAIGLLIIGLEAAGYYYYLLPLDQYISGLLQVVQWMNWFMLWLIFHMFGHEQKYWTCVQKCDVWMFATLFNLAGIGNCFLLAYDLFYVAYLLHTCAYLGALVSLLYMARE